jgi:spermidine synthase
MTLPPDYLLQRSLAPQQAGERLIALSEGSTELIAVVERAGNGRGLITNGHAMSSTAPLDQRYMRAMAHIPLLSMPSPRRALVIGFGVGNTTHAVSLHPSIERIEVADLSRHVLEQAPYFRGANGGVLDDPRVSVFLNDGRQHLQMADTGSFDLITLEPPPIAQAGVASLYSREFYELARTRLAPGGYISQWLPAYQVPAGASLAMVRAFLDVFPQSVLLSGMQAELILVGTTADRIRIAPDALAGRLAAAAPLRADLERLDLGTPREIIGTFVGSAETMARATAGVEPVTDDRPLQEYGVRSTAGTVLNGIPAALFDLSALGEWCGTCFAGEGGGPADSVAGLDLYLALLDRVYNTPPRSTPPTARQVLGSAYLGASLPDSPEVREILGGVHLRAGSAMLEAGLLEDAEVELREALRYLPASAEAHNDLGVVLAAGGRIEDARLHFAEAVRLQPDFTEARNNLARASQ